MKKVEPYLSFDDNCEEAFNFYHSVFGGDAPQIMRFKDVPDGPEGQSLPKDEGEKVMHVNLKLGDTNFMGSDTPNTMGKVNYGNNISLSILAESKDEADAIFNKLSAGGSVTMPMQDTFWGAYFGMVKDKFNINWMISYELPKQ